MGSVSGKNGQPHMHLTNEVVSKPQIIFDGLGYRVVSVSGDDLVPSPTYLYAGCLAKPGLWKRRKAINHLSGKYFLSREFSIVYLNSDSKIISRAPL